MTGHSAKTAPAATELKAREAGKSHTAIAMMRPTTRPASDACQAGRRMTPSSTRTAATGSAATMNESGKLPATGVSNCSNTSSSPARRRTSPQRFPAHDSASTISLKARRGGKSSSRTLAGRPQRRRDQSRRREEGLPLAVHVPFLGAGAGQFAHPLLVGAEGARIALVHDPAVVQHVSAIGDLDRRAHVLLDEQNREAFPPGRDDNSEHVLDNQRREALRRLVEHEQLGVQDQGAGDRQHLLLAARELRALVPSAFGKARKRLVDTGNRPRAGPLDGDQQVLVDRQIGEDAPPFWHIADAGPSDPEGGNPVTSAPNTATLPVRGR